MIRLHLNSKAADIVDMVAERHPQINEVLREAGRIIPDRSQAIRQYQAAIVYLLAAQYNGQTIIELGTKMGYSTCILSMAAPDARIFTVDNDPVMLEQARRNLADDFSNITFVEANSWDFADQANDGKVGMVFVDANHQRVKEDMVWWPKIKPSGLMLWHDYTPDKFPDVVAVVDRLADVQRPGAPPDVVVIGGNNNGMAGIYKTG